MEALFAEFASLSDQSLRDKSFDPSTIEDLLKLFELEAYKAWASQELDHQDELAQSESHIKESEEYLDSAMEDAMAEFRLFEEEMDKLCQSEYSSLIHVAETARKLGKNLEKAADFAATKYVEAAVGSAVASMKSAAKAISNNRNKIHPA
ncbi:hypothetical protein F511_05358 [Dorcoceras hygrometricum]|uniref:Uncharacterized protein n=1 Tax=Dorcoceras hygrometricum TaxID=472368 RepID=A0A2Z7AMP2_9LAMI|nr:hypothetical protein F511_05358 [Dorcoceras hygrometricum]